MNTSCPSCGNAEAWCDPSDPVNVIDCPNSDCVNYRDNPTPAMVQDHKLHTEMVAKQAFARLDAQVNSGQNQALVDAASLRIVLAELKRMKTYAWLEHTPSIYKSGSLVSLLFTTNDEANEAYEDIMGAASV